MIFHEGGNLRIMFWASLVSLAVSSSSAFSMAQRCGGDGPQPFIDLSVLPPKTQVIPTQGSVLEFQLWEGHDSLVYRNERHQIFNRYFKNGVDDQLGVSQVPLSPVVDRSEQAVLLDRAPWFYFRGEWVNFYVPVARPRHLFWNNSSLYMLENAPGTSHRPQQLTIHHLPFGSYQSQPICRVIVPVGTQYLESEGASYPVVPFYTVHATPAGNELSIFHVDASKCTVTSMGTYKDPFEAKILSVHRFGALNAYAIHTDHPTKNLMWDYGTGCHFFDIGKHPPIVPNPSRPLIATWDPQLGLEVMNLSNRNRATYFTGVPFKSVGPRDVQMTTRSDKLYFAPDGNPSSGRVVYEVDVKEVAH